MQYERDEDVTVQSADPATRSRAIWLVAAVVGVVGALAGASVLFEERFNPWVQDIAVAMGLVSLGLPFIPPLFMLYLSKGN